MPRWVVRGVQWSPLLDGSLKVNLSLSNSLGGAAALVCNLGDSLCFGVARWGLVDRIWGLLQVLFCVFGVVSFERAVVYPCGDFYVRVSGLL